MVIENLIKGIETKKIIGPVQNDIIDIQIDSRGVKKQSLFAALRGTQVDGHQYINQAIKQGAVAILCEDLPEQKNKDITYIQVPHSEAALGILASTFYDNPSSKLKLVGVTGTNGKTTVATILYKTFKKLGYKAGLLSTVCNYIDDEALETTHTTPDAVTINKLLHDMVLRGCDYAFMEVSSHAIDQKRISGLKFAGGIFTNLTRDHLDYHKTIANYIKAKKEFFDNLPKNAFSLVNLDDKNGMVMVQNTKSAIHTYSLRSLCDFKARVIESHFNGMILEINNTDVVVQFTGKFNVYNLLAVYGTACLLGQKADEVLIAISTLKSVSGRFETLQAPKGYTVIVDYAHTPDALTNVLTTIHDILDGKGKVITVVGAGGNRDKGKRPLMAKESIKNSDTVIITSDNPRFEDPQEIIKDMLDGLNTEEKQNVLTIENRRDAIKTACMLAKTNDVILIAGKGHETYQNIQGVKHHFDDKEEVRNIFQTQQI
ncbi:UDP-N-acetylmuramoyl-L-alanyl-D-glutamate--2,6-d iaminopimelateligase [Bacteroides coprosuis DSM 18011]|uniref:UDP-N-acetylmuramoyl-L-alanyl-D-glutamate--2,6-diaminopimelate ligase n=1 Tax=Bacteroides coprosuis DSM 18011 TaxID=679937 RepID=F3ZQ38_9BACE|nr:UDP-N-acetylmuramoyl-L-alanyl-D-glutamate--2,6-diaminopimelate ligase [Bacteroides coprosuis]EGJ70480.1 UDP-N-acetylmuramoyl-L-alanyl-D-glutamate--2,6-d iaminopimelateligase [Bacteroides coprosuis DSM 18011]